MKNEDHMAFDDVMLMKEKRRTSREKGKKTYDKTKLNPMKSKGKKVRFTEFDDPMDYEVFEVSKAIELGRGLHS